MKPLLVSFFISLLFTSCGKSLYYAYQNGEDYYSLEVTPRNEEIYRAKAASYNNEYIYIYIANFTDIRNDMIKYYNNEDYTILPFWSIYYLSKNKIVNCDLLKGMGELDKRKLYFNLKQDSLITKYRDINFDFSYYKDTKFFVGNGEDCIKNYNKNFLPPFMVKVDKIDFDKLQVEGIPKRLIKHPRKRKRGYHGE